MRNNNQNLKKINTTDTVWMKCNCNGTKKSQKGENIKRKVGNKEQGYQTETVTSITDINLAILIILWEPMI